MERDLKLQRRRDGFTLIELLTAMMIIALLAAIAMNRFWAVKNRGYRTQLKNDLRTVAIHQERYFEKNMQYATDPNSLPDISFSPGVTITITWTDPHGWAGTAAHSSLPGETCGYFTGDAPLGVAPPATESGKVACNE